MERRSLDTIAAEGVLVTLAIIGRGLAVLKEDVVKALTPK
jgi:hypothetical protein